MRRRLDVAVAAACLMVGFAPASRAAEAVVTVTIEVIALCTEGGPGPDACKPVQAPTFAEQPYVLSPELESLRRVRGGTDMPVRAMPLVDVIY